MIPLIFSITAVIITIYGQGIIFNKIFNKIESNHKNFNETFIFGIIFLSFNALVINFFIPISKYVGTFFLIVSFIYFFIILFQSSYKIKYLKKILILIILTFLLIAFSNINRPDAGLYHLPYVSIINENTIIFGIVNLHPRFGHISIIQYLSSIFNNFILPREAILIPLAIIFSCIIVSIFSSLQRNLKYGNIHLSIILFFLTIFSIYSFNRYSSYGNDAPAHLFFILMIINIILQDKVDTKFFGNIFLLATFLFLVKPFMLILAPIIIYLFFKIKIKISDLLDRKIIFTSAFLLFWILKNIITSGCLIYPISLTCSNYFDYYDSFKTNVDETSGEAWSKDWINYKEKKHTIEDYNKNFNWLKTWSDNHLKKVIEKFGPFFLFLLLFSLIFFLNRNQDKRNHKFLLCIEIKFLLFFLFFLSLVWFIKFPIYRYGSSFLSVLCILISIFCLEKYSFSNNFLKIKKIINYTIIFGIVIFFFKNSYRIIINPDQNFIWPQIYNLNNSKQKKIQDFEKISLNNGGYYFFSNGELCMYSSSPCTHININDISFSIKFKYYKMFLKK